MIKLVRLVLNNFLSHKDTEIDLTNYEGLTLIEGKTYDGRYSSNGSGKSTILEGIYYALTGKTLRGLTADAVVNNKIGKNTEVLLDFDSAGHECTVSRYRKHDINQNNVLLVIDGEDRTSRLPTETQRTIDDLVDLPNDILSGILIMGEGLSSRFTSLPDPAKKSLLENTIRLSHDISNLRESVKSKLKVAREKLQFNEGQLVANRNLIDDYRRQLQENPEELAAKKEELETWIKESEEKYKSLHESSEDYLRKISVLTTSINQYDHLNSLLLQESAKESGLLDQLSSVLADIPTCPLCHQSLSDPEEVKSSINSQLLESTNSKIGLTSRISSLPSRDVMESKIQSLSNSQSSIAQECSNLNYLLGNSRTQLNSILEKLTTRSQVTSQIESLEKTVLTLQGESGELTSEIESLAYLDKQIFSPTGVIVDILGGVVSYIDSRLQVYTSLLLDKDFHLTFTKGKISIDSRTPYQSLSNGEKRRLDISIQFALHDYIYTHCGIGFDTLFIDEVLDTLDVVGVSNIMEVLALKMEYCSLKRIFVVTHNDELKSYFDSSLSVSKDSDGITHLV